MRKIWNHSRLGDFEYDGMDWRAIVDVPAFKAFEYDTGYGNAPRSNGQHVLAFAAHSDRDFPSQDCVNLVLKIVSHQDALASKILDSLWNDFTGRGPDSGMYWHGNLEQLAEDMDSVHPLDKREDLFKLLQLSQITVYQEVNADKPVAILSFHASFEEEHGVGLLTDGENILGIGYDSEVTPFAK